MGGSAKNPFSGLFKSKKGKGVATGFSATASLSVQLSPFDQPAVPTITFPDLPPPAYEEKNPFEANSSPAGANAYPVEKRQNPFASSDDALAGPSTAPARPLGRAATSSTIGITDMIAACGPAAQLIDVSSFNATPDEIHEMANGKTDFFALGNCSTVAIVENSGPVAKYGLKAPLMAVVSVLMSIAAAYGTYGTGLFCDNTATKTPDDPETGIKGGGWQEMTSRKEIMRAFQAFNHPACLNDCAHISSGLTKFYCQTLRDIKENGEMAFPAALNIITFFVSSPTSWKETVDNVLFAAREQDALGIPSRQRQIGFQFIFVTDKKFVKEYLDKTNKPRWAERMFKAYCDMVRETTVAFSELDDNLKEQLNGRDNVDFKTIDNVTNLKGIPIDDLASMLLGAVSEFADLSNIQS